MTRPVMPGAIANRQAEIELSLRMSRRHSYGRHRLAAAVLARLPEPGAPAISDIARCAALSELAALAANGVLVLGPDEGPQPGRAR